MFTYMKGDAEGQYARRLIVFVGETASQDRWIRIKGIFFCGVLWGMESAVLAGGGGVTDKTGCYGGKPGIEGWGINLCLHR